LEFPLKGGRSPTGRGNSRGGKDMVETTPERRNFMAKHLNPLEKEFLIRQYRGNQRISINDFCNANHITVPSLKKWMKQYDEGGLEGLVRADAQSKDMLPTF